MNYSLFSVQCDVSPFVKKHHNKADGQEYTADPDCSVTDKFNRNTSEPGTDGEKKYDRKICHALFEHRFVVRAKINRQSLGSTPEIADAHRACICVSPDLVEGLNLQCTDK